MLLSFDVCSEGSSVVRAWGYTIDSMYDGLN